MVEAQRQGGAAAVTGHRRGRQQGAAAVAALARARKRGRAAAEGRLGVVAGPGGSERGGVLEQLERSSRGRPARLREHVRAERREVGHRRKAQMVEAEDVLDAAQQRVVVVRSVSFVPGRM